ncbi:MAG: MFS transporter [Anaerolineae bacterium]
MRQPNGNHIHGRGQYHRSVETEERAKNMTLLGMAYGLGFIIGPAVGGAVGQISLDLPALAAGVVSLISVALICTLPETLPKERRETPALRLRSDPVRVDWLHAAQAGAGRDSGGVRALQFRVRWQQQYRQSLPRRQICRGAGAIGLLLVMSVATRRLCRLVWWGD